MALIVVTAYKKQVLNSVTPGGTTGAGIVTYAEWVDYMWRLLIGLGCVPGAVALYFRLTIPETPRFTMDIACDVQQAARDVGDFLNTGAYYVDPDAVAQRAQALAGVQGPTLRQARNACLAAIEQLEESGARPY